MTGAEYQDYHFDLGPAGKPNKVTAALLIQLDKEQRDITLGNDWIIEWDSFDEFPRDTIEITFFSDGSETDGVRWFYESRYASYPDDNRPQTVANIINDMIALYEPLVRKPIKESMVEFGTDANYRGDNRMGLRFDFDWFGEDRVMFVGHQNVMIMRKHDVPTEEELDKTTVPDFSIRFDESKYL